MNKMNEEKKQTTKRMIKKGLTFSLCLALAGGSLTGLHYVSGLNKAENVQAAIRKEDGLTLTKAKKQDNEGTENKGSLDVSDIVEEAMPSVVSITTKSIQEVQSYYGMFGFGDYAPEQREVEGAGSGIIIGMNDDELLIATNYHVVQGAETVTVSFIDNNTYEAKVKGYEAAKDLAVVAVPLDDIEDDTMDEISIATIGSSDDLKVGEQVIAIGNAMGYGQSVTTGIVSAKNRRLDSEYANSFDGQTEDEDSDKGINLIQTDAAINPGNSGGALLNMDGEVVGINSAKLASTEIEGVGYSIAISDVSDILENLMNEKSRDKLDDDKHGVLGITGATVSDEANKVYGVPEGVVIMEVNKGGAADKADIPEKSIITEFDGKTVTTIQDLVERLSYYEPGEEVDVTIQILSGNKYKEKTITVTLGENTDAKEDSDDESDSSDDSYNDNNSDDNNSRDRRGADIFQDWMDEQDGDMWQ